MHSLFIKNIMKAFYLFLYSFFIITATAQNVIRVIPEQGDMTTKIQAAIDKAKKYNGKAVVIEFQNANYHIHRNSSSQIVYHISNTTSEQDNPNPIKHIGLWLKDLKNVTIDGQGWKRSPFYYTWRDD